MLRNRNRSRNPSRNPNRRNCTILTQEEPEPYPCSRFRLRFRFLLHKKYQTKSTLTGALADTCMKLARDETKIRVTGRSFYRKNNLKFKGKNRNQSRNRSQNRNRGWKIGTRNRNRNLGKMARFRNTAIKYIQNMLPILLEYKIHNNFALFKSKPNFDRLPNFNFCLQNLSPYFNTIRNAWKRLKNYFFIR